jgi:hypothetical protein
MLETLLRLKKQKLVRQALGDGESVDPLVEKLLETENSKPLDSSDMVIDKTKKQSLKEMSDQFESIGFDENLIVASAKNSKLSIFLSLILVFGVSFSRVYFGVHSLSQVCTGMFLGWLIFELMEIFRTPLVKKWKNMSNTAKSTKTQVLLSLGLLIITTAPCFFLVYYFQSTSPNAPPVEIQHNLYKCPKCTNYYQSTLNGLLGIYVIPCFIFICNILSILTTTRQKKDIDIPGMAELKNQLILMFLAILIVMV